MTNHPEGNDAAADTSDQGDGPIRSLTEDRLGRRPFAEALAAEILAAPASRGYVVGVTGAWGSGKTSILNMAVEALGDEAVIVHFNPWMFSGTEALVASFFEEIGKQLERRESVLRGIAGKLATYGHLLSPLASLVGAGNALGSAAVLLELLSTGPSVQDRRKELLELLSELERRLVVVVDDVDRLRPQEVLDIVRLVRLVGDFPNTLYLLAFDRARVEECLGGDNIERGRAYLEKVVQVMHEVPVPRESDITTIFVAGLERLFATLPTGPFEPGDWQNVFAFIVRPLLTTPRRVRRLLASLPMTMRIVGEEISLADLIGIEAIRVLFPAMFAAIVSVADSLSPHGVMRAQQVYGSGQSVADSPFGAMAQVDPELAKNICRWLFPAARQYFENMSHGTEWEVTWHSERKIGSAAVFRFYLERQLPADVVPARTVEQALAAITNRERLQALLAPLSGADLMDLVERMNASLEDTPLDGDAMEDDPARMGLPVLLDLLPRLPEDTGMFSFSGSMVLIRAALRLLKRIPSEETRAEVIRSVLTDTRSLSARLVLLQVAGHREGIGMKLVSEEVAQELEEELRSQLLTLPASGLAAETRTARLADFMAETNEGSEKLQQFIEDDRLVLSLFVWSVGQTSVRQMGAAAKKVTKVLAWDALVALVGKDTLRRRTAELEAAATENRLELSAEEHEALGLASDYAAGNRPDSPLDRVTKIQEASATAESSGGGGASALGGISPASPRDEDDRGED